MGEPAPWQLYVSSRSSSAQGKRTDCLLFKCSYKFSAPGQYGLHWYHAHVRGYLDDGVKGLIYIYPHANRTRPFSLISSDEGDIAAMMEAEKNPRSMALYDWRHVQEDEAIAMFDSSGRPTTCVDSVLINGASCSSFSSPNTEPDPCVGATPGKGRSFCPTADYLEEEAARRYDALPYFASHVDSRGCLIIPGSGSYNAEAISSPMGCTNSTADVDIVPTQGKWTMLNVANVGGEWTWTLSIDEHDLWVVAADGDYITPKKVQALPVSIGQRYTVLVPTDKAQGGDYFIRANSQGFAQVLAGVGVLRYDDDENAVVRRQDPVMAPSDGDALGDPWSDLSKASVRYNSSLINGAYQFDAQQDAPAFPAQSPPSKADMTFVFHANQTNTTVFQIGSQPLADVQELNLPVLFSQPGRGLEQDPSWLYRIPYGAVVDVIMQNAPNALFPAPAEPPHPIHLHGHKYWVLGSKEYETWQYANVQDALQSGNVNLNLNDPPSRDTFLLPTAGWLVLRFVADNPGAWLMHCHSMYGMFRSLTPSRIDTPLLSLAVSSHLHAGMGVVFLEAPDRLDNIPDSYKTPPTTTPYAPRALIRGATLMGTSL